MEKLDEILRAEEDARHALADAHSRAVVTREQARTAAAAALEQAKRESEARAAEIRESALGEARADADAIASASETELEDTIRAARDRKPAAVQAALEELVG